jgi:multicomponent Na+:H+ antiporter subunit G
MNIISMIFMAAGTFFFISGTAGILRFPDFYTRTHTTTKCDTMGTLLIIAGFMIESGLNIQSMKLLFVVIFVYLTAPVASHVLAKSAYKDGLKPWRKK